jgi:hypothetical protein
MSPQERIDSLWVLYAVNYEPMETVQELTQLECALFDFCGYGKVEKEEETE